jgi:hypothetical protein
MSPSAPLGPLLHSFFHEHLITVKGLRPASVRSYRDTIRLLLVFLAADKRSKITRLTLGDLTFQRVVGFLRHLEQDRGNHIRTVASNCTSCRCDFGLRDVGGVRDALAAFLLDVRWERDAVAVGVALACSEVAG